MWKMRATDRLPLCRPYDRREQAPPSYENLATAMPPLKREGDRR